MGKRRFVSSVLEMPGAVYSPFADRIAEQDVPPVALHVGDTWLPACPGTRMEDLSAADHPDLHRYAPTAGIPPLIDAVVEKVRARNALACEREGVLIGAGATGALANAIGSASSPRMKPTSGVRPALPLVAISLRHISS